MGRPLRIEFDGALYHVTSRGDRLEGIGARTFTKMIMIVRISQVILRRM